MRNEEDGVEVVVVAAEESEKVKCERSSNCGDNGGDGKYPEELLKYEVEEDGEGGEDKDCEVG